MILDPMKAIHIKDVVVPNVNIGMIVEMVVPIWLIRYIRLDTEKFHNVVTING